MELRGLGLQGQCWCCCLHLLLPDAARSMLLAASGGALCSHCSSGWTQPLALPVWAMAAAAVVAPCTPSHQWWRPVHHHSATHHPSSSSSFPQVRFYYSFTSKDCLYLVMEYLSGGDCYSLLRTMGALDEDAARTYIAETVLALEYCHANVSGVWLSCGLGLRQ